MAGPVFRRDGSAMTWSFGSAGRNSAVFAAYASFVETYTLSTTSATRANVSSISERPSKILRNCFGFSSELSGRSLVPPPPARISAQRFITFPSNRHQR